MTPSPFQIKSTLGRSYRVDLDDTRRAKEALLRLGYFETPRYGLTQYPDEPLFAAIEAFQQDNGLERDGIMGPDGETAIHLGRALANLDEKQNLVLDTREVSAGDEWDRRARPLGRASQILSQPSVFDLIKVVAEGLDNDPTDIEATKRALGWAGYYPSDGSASDIFASIRRFQSDHGLEVDGYMHPRGPTARALDEAVAHKVLAWREEHPEARETDAADDDVQIAQVGPIAKEILKRFGPSLLPPLADALRPRPKTDGLPPTQGEVPKLSPPGSPAEPPEDHSKEEIVPAEQDIPVFRGRPINEVLKADPAVFEIVSNELKKSLGTILESHRGDKTTQEGNRRTAEMCVEEFKKGWAPENTFEHVAGASKKQEDGKYVDLPEKHIPNRQTGGRLGSSNPDFTFEVQRPSDAEPHYIEGISGNTLQDGQTPVASEQRQLERLARNVGKDDLVGFFPKLRPGMDKAVWENRVRAKCRELLETRFGKPQQQP